MAKTKTCRIEVQKVWGTTSACNIALLYKRNCILEFSAPIWDRALSLTNVCGSAKMQGFTHAIIIDEFNNTIRRSPL